MEIRREHYQYVGQDKDTFSPERLDCSIFGDERGYIKNGKYIFLEEQEICLEFKDKY